MRSIHSYGDLFLDAHLRKDFINLGHESTALFHGMNQEVQRGPDDRIADNFFASTPVPGNNALCLHLRFGVSLVQSKLVSRGFYDGQIDDRPMCLASNGQACIAKEVHKSWNTLGESDNLFQHASGKWRVRAAKACGMQPLGNVGAYFGQAQRTQRATVRDPLPECTQFRLPEQAQKFRLAAQNDL